ncbi:MAG: SPFH domain-containing protein [Lachnospiraceae bacterium]|nr:SPFH domain-containing protein [Lachnospiraceae bacterium]
MKKGEEIKTPSGIHMRERILTWRNGMLFGSVFSIAFVVCSVYAFKMFSRGVTEPSLKLILFALYGMTAAVWILIILCRGLKIVKPNEAAIFTLFGRYHATIMQPGFYFVNPFATEEGVVRRFGAFRMGGIVGGFLNGYGRNGNRIPLLPMIFSMELDNVRNTQKGYVLSMGLKIEYRIYNPTKALFIVDNFGQYFHENCEAILRSLIRERLSYGEGGLENIDTEVKQIINQISTTGKSAIQEKLAFIGVEVLSIAIKEAYDKREKRYYSLEEL